MDRETVIRLAREAGFEQIVCGYNDGTLEVEVPNLVKLEHFAKLVVAAEREACLTICEEQAETNYWEGADICAAAIRARGERPCTCSPADNPPVPCARQYALTECRIKANEI